MEIKEFIRLELDNLKKGTTRVLDGLTPQELAWRPCSGCNSIGLIAFHMPRSEDGLVQSRIQGKPQVWESDKWYKKMNLPVDDEGSHYSVDQVNAFSVPDIADIVAYAGAVRAHTLEYLNNMTSDEFNRQITMRMGPMPVSEVLALIVRHTSQHIGEISYLRGMQRGMDK